MITESEAKRIILSNYGIEAKAYLIHLHSREDEVHKCPKCNTDSHDVGLSIYFCPKCKKEW